MNFKHISYLHFGYYISGLEKEWKSIPENNVDNNSLSQILVAIGGSPNKKEWIQYHLELHICQL